MNFKKIDYEERYFVGKSINMIPGKGVNAIPELWNDFMKNVREDLSDITLIEQYIGFEMYPHDFLETHEFVYHAMVQTKDKVEVSDYDTIVLPAGKYILFEIGFDDIVNEIQNVYKYVKDNRIDISYAFDYEHYLMDQNYSEKGQKLNFCFLLKGE